MQRNRTQWSRRNFLRLGGASALAGVSPAISQAKAEEILASPVNPKPVVDARFPCRIGDGVWVIPDKRIFLVPNIGIVEGKHSVLVIDSGLGPESGRNVLSAARAIAGKRRLILTMTHAHPEHTFGAQAFKGEAQIFYNRAQRDHLARSAKVLLQGFHSVLLQNQLALLDQIEITTPDDVYQEDKTEIDLGDRRVELRSIGTAHSPGDQIITIRDQKIVFVGDLIEERMFPIVPYFPPMIEAGDINVENWEAALNEVSRHSPKIVVPGHGNLGGAEIADQVRAYLGQVRRIVTSTGVVNPEALNQLVKMIREQNPTWERTEFIAPAVKYFAANRSG